MVKKKQTISVIINAKNEEDFIADCLESVKWADEILVLISPDSIDKTAEIIRKFKVRMIEQKTKEMDFAAWHNQGMEEARGDWLLWVDADERIPPLLKEELLLAIRHKLYACYAIPRRNFLLGKELRHGGWCPDYVKRLFLKKNLEKWTGVLHEEPIFKGEMKKLINPLIHLQPDIIEPALEKSIKWANIEAKLLYEANHPPVVWWRILRMGLTTLFDRLIKKQGFRDGTEGWIESFYQAFHTMIIYMRLWELQREK